MHVSYVITHKFTISYEHYSVPLWCMFWVSPSPSHINLFITLCLLYIIYLYVFPSCYPSSAPRFLLSFCLSFSFLVYVLFLFLISNFRRVLNLVYILLGISPASDCGLPTFRNPLSVPSSYEDGTDRVFRNVGIQQSDAGEIPKRIHTRSYFYLCDFCFDLMLVSSQYCFLFQFFAI